MGYLQLLIAYHAKAMTCAQSHVQLGLYKASRGFRRTSHLPPRPPVLNICRLRDSISESLGGARLNSKVLVWRKLEDLEQSEIIESIATL